MPDTQILLTNDDGIEAPGLALLADALCHVAPVTVAAPDREQSAIGTAVTLFNPLEVQRRPDLCEGVQTYSVTGTPGDCVILALEKLLPGGVSLVVSGINNGSNLGEDVFISGTVSGAMQAYLTATPVVFIILMGVRPEVYGFYIMIMPTLYVVATITARRLMVRISLDRIILLGVTCSAAGGLLQFLFGLWGVTTPYPVLVAFAISNFGTGLVLAICYAQALNAVAPAIAGQASALGGFLHMGWGGILSIAVANMTHTSSLQFGIAQMTTTWLAATTALVLIFVVNTRMALERG